MSELPELIGPMRGGYQGEGLGQLILQVSRHFGRPLRVIEVGSYAGESAVIMAPHCEQLWTVDQWLDGYDPLDPNPALVLQPMAEIEQLYDATAGLFPQITKVRMSSAAAAADFGAGDVDMVYLDANHQYESVMQDLRLWLPKIQPGGVIAGHDYSDAWWSVRRAVNEVFGGPHELYCDSSWLFWLGRREYHLPEIT